MMEKRVELLAPCGSYESFLAAVRAGADAVYLGGKAFGARAYAENFSEEELISVIRQAHLFGVSVYLTVNTLVKEQEFSAVYEYILPLYGAGLDGAIVQDMGVFRFLRRNFPDLKLHASTQMTITGSYGAAFLKEMGCERIVPARELSLQEIKAIKREVPIEIEVFVHGAMCYCYSGQCLMSSMIGGRSGNRGRCAQPCRLPYKTAGKEGYFLSLKDMNTLEHLPELIEAGVDSFKIEGRMKRPEYVAGVVSIYRKYIDKYYRKKIMPNLPERRAESGGGEKDRREKSRKGLDWSVSLADRKILSDLYIRSETGNGYYEISRGKEMLTLKKPGYNEADQALLGKLRETYVRELPKVRLDMRVRCRAGEVLYGEVRLGMAAGGASDYMTTAEVPLKTAKPSPAAAKVLSQGSELSPALSEFVLTAEGPVVEFAQKRAVSAEEIREQITRTGDTPFVVERCEVETDENAFVPMKWIKQLRRELLEKIYMECGAREREGVCEEKGGKVCEAEGRSICEAGDRKVCEAGDRNICEAERGSIRESKGGSIWETGAENIRLSESKGISEGKVNGKKANNILLTEIVQTKEQFEVIYAAMVKDMPAVKKLSEAGDKTEGKNLWGAEKASPASVTEYLIADADLLLEEPEIPDRLSGGKVYWGVKCPLILRKKDEGYLQKLGCMIEEKKPDLVYCGTVDVLAWVKSLRFQGGIAGEASLYAWNKEALSFWGEELDRVSIPLELDSREIRSLSRSLLRGREQDDRKADGCILGAGRGGEKDDRRADGCTLGAGRSGEQLICAHDPADKLEAPVYGRVPFMVSANCIKLSSGRCDKNRKLYTELTDRMGNVFPVYTNCSHCYNIIYNYLPTSCYDHLWMLLEDKIRAFRIEFTTEEGKAAGQIRQTFRDFLASELKDESGKPGRRAQARKQRQRKDFREITKTETTQGRFAQGVE